MAIWIQVILDIKENDASLLFPFFFFFFTFNQWHILAQDLPME